MQNHVDTLAGLASALAARTPDFQAVKGAGEGDHATNSFMRHLRADAEAALRADFSEKKICGNNSFAADFYFPAEGAIVEVALGLHNPASEFEKDILKAFMARESGHLVRRLVFIARAGAAKKCAQPGRSAVIAWARAKHDLAIEIRELPGTPRVRKPRSTRKA
jgi:hypothetical protein